MGVRVDIRVPQEYPRYCIALLETLFADYASVSVTKHFTEGQSGTFVVLLEATRPDGTKELPVVVKIGLSHLIKQEWRATKDYINGQLPGFVPISQTLAAVPVVEEDGNTASYSAARYELAGNGVFEIETLRKYALTASSAELWRVLEKRLFQQLDRIWNSPTAPILRRVSATYDRVLPVNLLLELTEAETASTIQLDATHDPADYPSCQPGDVVQLLNFIVTEIDRADRTLTMDLPNLEGLHPYAYRLRVRNVAHIDQYHLLEKVSSLTGRVQKTRQLLLQGALHAALSATIDLTQPILRLPESDEALPNPLLQWPALLQEEMHMRIGTVHGDLNTGNVLIDVDAGTTFLIDCAHAHRDHALYDLVRLESEVLLHLVAERFFSLGLEPTAIHDLYNWLGYVTRREPNPPGSFSLPQPLLQKLPPLQSTFIALTTIRNCARQYLAQREQWREYYVALILTLLGSLKFTSLDWATAGTNPKAIAFWGAATLLARLEQPAQLLQVRWEKIAVNEVDDVRPGISDSKQPNVFINYEMKGNIITGGTTNATNIVGPVTGPIHTGSGNIYGSQTGHLSSENRDANERDASQQQLDHEKSTTKNEREATDQKSVPMPTQRKIKILFLTANPLDTVRLRVDEEIRAIDQSLRQAEYRIFDTAIHQAVRISDLQELLLRHQPDIVHFSGHGTATNELILQDANGNATLVPGTALRSLFAIFKAKIRCVVLNACYTDEQAKSLAEVIDCVVGIDGNVTDQAAIQFSTAFYRALGYGRSVQDAFQLGQVQIELDVTNEIPALQLYGSAAACTYFVNKQPDPYEERRLDAAMPSRCSFNQRTEVRVLIALSSSEGLRKFLPDYTEEGSLISKQDVEVSPSTIEFPIDPQTCQIGNTTLYLRLVAPDFKIDKDVVEIQILPKQDSGIVTFYLTPTTRPGIGRVKVELYNKQQLLLTTVSLTTQIALTPTDVVNQIVWRYIYAIIGAYTVVGMNTTETYSSEHTTSESHNRTDIHTSQGVFHTGSGNIFQVTLFQLPFDGIKAWVSDFFRLDQADEHARSSWAGKMLYVLGSAMQRVSSENFLTFLLAALVTTLAIWFITPLLAWPQSDAQQRLFAAIRFGVASLILPGLIAFLIKPEGTEKYATDANADLDALQRKLLFLKLAGAWTGFGALAGTALTVVILWYHLFGATMPTLGRWFLALLPPFFAYVSAQRIPLDRYKMFKGELRLHDADPLFLAVFALFGPILAAVLYWGHEFLINRAAMLSVLLGIIGITVWEIHKSDKNRFPDVILIGILGVLLPLGFLLLFFFDMGPWALSPAFVIDTADLIVIFSVYVLGTTLVLATVAVRQLTVLSLPGVLGLLAIVLILSAITAVDLGVGRVAALGVVLLWYLWGRRQFRAQGWLLFHPSVDWLFAALIGATLLGYYTNLALWGNALLFGLVASVLVLWAYRSKGDATKNQTEQTNRKPSAWTQWGIGVFLGIAVVGSMFVIRDCIFTIPIPPTPTESATPTPSAKDTVTPTSLPTASPTETPSATATLQRLTVKSPAPGKDRYFIEDANFANSEWEQLLAVYAQDAAGSEFDVAVVFVVNKNTVQLIFQNENYPLSSLSALQLDTRLEDVDFASMKPLDDSYVGFMLSGGTARLVADANLQEGDQLEAVQLTSNGDTLPFLDGPLLLYIDRISTNRTIARVSSARGVPPIGTLLTLPTSSQPNTPSPISSPTQVITPTATATPAPQLPAALSIYESFDGIVKLTWENAQGEWGVNNQRLQVRRFENGLAAVFIANPDWSRYTVQLDFGTLKQLDDSGNVNVPFSNFHVLIHFQGNTNGYWFTVANNGTACTLQRDGVSTQLGASLSQWGEMFNLLLRQYSGDHTLKIRVYGNQYAFMLDDQEICSFQDDTYSNGKLGVAVSEGASGRMWIDNVRIEPLD